MEGGGGVSNREGPQWLTDWELATNGGNIHMPQVITNTATIGVEGTPRDADEWKPSSREVSWLQARFERGKRERFVEIATITPGIATLMLRHNHGNRPIRPPQVAVNVDRLQRGDFKLTHQGIAFAKTQVLNDGQHRLSAIVETGISATMTVTFGAEREEFGLIDQMKGRGAADILGIMGEDHRALRASVAKTLLQVKESKAKTFDPQLVADYAVELRGETMDAALRAGQHMKNVCAPTAISVAHYWIAQHTKKPQHFAKFWEGIRDGENLSGLKLRLREWMRRKEFNHAVADYTINKAGGIVNAWNAFVSGKRTFSQSWNHVSKLPDVL
jgi:hypothetical protein